VDVAQSLRAQAQASHRADSETYIPVPHSEISPALKARDAKGPSSDGDGDGAILVPMLAHSLRAEGFDASEDGTGRGTPLVPVSMRESGQGFWMEDDVAGTLRAEGENRPSRPSNVIATPIAFDCKASGQNGFGVGEVASTMRSMGHTASHQNGGGHQAVAFMAGQGAKARSLDIKTEQTPSLKASNSGLNTCPSVMLGMKVRRLTPRECERLQGFPDDYTLIPFTHGKPAADGPRYKALGNSMAVSCMLYIGELIAKASCKSK